ncbi:MAG: RelA/SpoT family protein [Muribaculaceae bacterium]|nr:RelA/SpoT family protein [Muribaculaceae bacterium]
MNESYFTDAEKREIISHCFTLMRYYREVMLPDDFKKIKGIISDGILQNHYKRDKYGINPTLRNIHTAILLAEKIAADRNMTIAILLYNLCKSEFIPESQLRENFGDDITHLINGLLKVSRLYQKRAAVQSDNFRNLLLTFAEDIRVIIIMIVDRLGIMRMINKHPNENFVKDISFEAMYLYAPLAHRLGLYSIKSELEDLSLKYTNRDIYSQIAHKLNETKQGRDEYIENFIEPIKKKLLDNGLNFEIKGRTKSIYSIWNKIKKQNTDLDHIYDLFAIRVIIDTSKEREKTDCWVAYSIIVDMYRSNPSRMKDWLTIPKSNGYESLHTTVYGPEDKWVEVQIRSRRMDEIAERGLAAHWKYKGGRSEQNLDEWMNNVRDLLETAETGPSTLMKDIKMDVYNKEVFVFTPKGDLYRLPLGSSILDFAFQIHSKLGCTCIGGKVDGKNQKLNYKLKSGDSIEILTSSSQVPKLDWLNFVVTSKARNKIKQTVNEMNNKSAELGKELLMRRLKNRKIEVDEGILMKAIKKLGFKTVTDFFSEIANEKLDINRIIELYTSIEAKEQQPTSSCTAENFSLNQPKSDEDSKDVLEIGENIKDINYKLAKCCNPIFGDDIRGFISSEGAIKIHRANCPNVIHLCDKYPYREIATRWSNKIGSQYAVTLRIIGYDDIGIVTNITSIISKESKASLRNISIESNLGLFQGYLVIGVSDNSLLADLIKKIKAVKGVKNVQRSN